MQAIILMIFFFCGVKITCAYFQEVMYLLIYDI